jgi:N-acyl-L-homoserine lactone synthetase
VDSTKRDASEGLAEVNKATAEMFCGLVETCIMCGITELFTLYDMRIARLLRRVDCRARAVSERIKIDEHPTEIGAFLMNDEMLSRLRTATGTAEALVTPDMLPPVLKARYDKVQKQQALTALAQLAEEDASAAAPLPKEAVA